ncbi:hypothetical protein Vi05172_g4404 [Venturia inaequalis]|nr:hypothetical protein Vi05172_g4404 [Venturia inaequalis]
MFSVSVTPIHDLALRLRIHQVTVGRKSDALLSPKTDLFSQLAASRFTLHASRFTLHASRFTLHASRFTLHDNGGAGYG